MKMEKSTEPRCFELEKDSRANLGGYLSLCSVLSTRAFDTIRQQEDGIEPFDRMGSGLWGTSYDLPVSSPRRVAKKVHNLAGKDIQLLNDFCCNIELHELFMCSEGPVVPEVVVPRPFRHVCAKDVPSWQKDM